MSVPTGDYNNYSSSNFSCAYASLGNITAKYSLVGKNFAVPQWGGPSYDTAYPVEKSCFGYPTVDNAYGSQPSGCGSAVPSLEKYLEDKYRS